MLIATEIKLMGDCEILRNWKVIIGLDVALLSF